MAIAAPPKLDYIFPAGVQRGQTAEVTVAGTIEKWPVKVWVDRAGVNVSAGEKKGQLSVSTDEDVDFGLCWVRLYDDEGASQLRPLMIGTLPEILEAEPNNSHTQPQQLAASALINGKLSERGDVDTFSIELKQGQTLVASLEAHETLNSPMDSVLQIVDARGFVLAQNNDARGLDPLIVFKAPADAKYLVRTFAFPSKPNSTIDFASGENFVYRLTITTGAFLDHTLPLAVQRGQTTGIRLIGWNLPEGDEVHKVAADTEDRISIIDYAPSSVAGMIQLPVVSHDVVVEAADHSSDSPQTVEVPSVVSGTLNGAKEVDVYRYSAAKGKELVMYAESHALGFPMDPVLEVVNAAGEVLAKNDDATRDERDARLVFTPPVDGAFELRIRDLHGRGGERFAYRLTIEPETPRFQVALKAGEFTVEAGKSLEISVTVTREGGFAQTVEITAIDLPAGITAEPASSAANGATAKEVKLKLTAAQDASSGPFFIVGRAADETATSPAQFSLGETGQLHFRLWVTVRR